MYNYGITSFSACDNKECKCIGSQQLSLTRDGDGCVVDCQCNFLDDRYPEAQCTVCKLFVNTFEFSNCTVLYQLNSTT